MQQDPQKAKARARKYRKRFLIKAAITAAAVYILCTQVICIRRAGGNSMFPAIKEGDLVIAYRIGRPSPGEAVLYRDDGGSEHFGRVAASAGMKVDINEDGYFVDGYHPSEEIFYPTEAAENGGTQFPLIVPDDEFFILNDFRPQVDDGRCNGCTKAEDIIGTAVFVLRRRGI